MKHIFFLVLLFSNISFAQPLAPNSPEIRQLIAMGAEILKEEKGDENTIVNFGNNTISFSRNSYRLVASRIFTRERKLNQEQEFELMKLINKLNTNYSYQFILGDNTITANLYLFGNHDPKAFIMIVRNLDTVSSIFDDNPTIFKLVNN